MARYSKKRSTGRTRKGFVRGTRGAGRSGARSGRGTARRGQQTVRLVIEQVAQSAQPSFGASGVMSAVAGAPKKASF